MLKPVRIKVLVTGAAGQVGRALSMCVPESIDYIGMDRLALDLSDERSIVRAIRFHRPDWVINCGAITSLEFAQANREMTMAVNAKAPMILARELEETGGKLLQVSTDYVFDGRKRAPYKPNDPVNPLSVYGESKVLAEEAARICGVVLRTSWVHSAHGINFVTWVIRKLRQSEKLLVEGSQVGRPTHARDLAHTIWQLIGANAVGTFHYSDDGTTNRFELAVEAAKRGSEAGIVPPDYKISRTSSVGALQQEIRPSYCVLEDSPIRHLLEFRSRHWRENVLRTVDELASVLPPY